MLLVPTPTAANKADNRAEKVLRRLEELLPDHWVIAGCIPSKSVSDTGRRGRTKPIDAIVIGEKTIFILDVRSYPGLIAIRDKSPFQTNGKDIDDKENLPNGFWSSFQKEAYKVKVLLKERFEIDTIRVLPKMIWARSQRFDYGDSGREEDVTDVRNFARLAMRRDSGSSLPPIPKSAVTAITKFLMDDDSLVLGPAEAGPRDVGERPYDRAERARELAEAKWTPVKAGDDKPARTGEAKLAKAAPRAAPTEAEQPRSEGTAGSLWLWLIGVLILIGAASALVYSQAGPRDEVAPAPPPKAEPAPAVARPPAVTVQPFASPQTYLVGSGPVAIRTGPGPEFPTVRELASGTELIGTGTARGAGGSTWIAVTPAGGPPGFVPDGMVGPKVEAPPPITASAPTPEPVASAPARKTTRGADQPRRQANRPPRRRSETKQAAPAATSSTISCILPSGEEIQTSYATCRARSGVIYR